MSETRTAGAARLSRLDFYGRTALQVWLGLTAAAACVTALTCIVAALLIIVAMNFQIGMTDPVACTLAVLLMAGGVAIWARTSSTFPRVIRHRASVTLPVPAHIAWDVLFPVAGQPSHLFPFMEDYGHVQPWRDRVAVDLTDSTDGEPCTIRASLVDIDPPYTFSLEYGVPRPDLDPTLRDLKSTFTFQPIREHAVRLVAEDWICVNTFGAWALMHAIRPIADHMDSLANRAMRRPDVSWAGRMLDDDHHIVPTPVVVLVSAALWLVGLVMAVIWLA